MPMSSWLHSSCEIDKITDDTTMGAITDGIADWCAAAFRKKELGIPVRKNNVRLVHVHTGPTGRVVLSPLHPEDTAASVDLFNIAHLVVAVTYQPFRRRASHGAAARPIDGLGHLEADMHIAERNLRKGETWPTEDLMRACTPAPHARRRAVCTARRSCRTSLARLLCGG
mmetsp:Transcript_27399/g.69196  ORF Transcript_27399/g.69196 Transcript_27399/m.69196 type:complete len:170 (+) Transcript_27399:130-639(+)